MRNKGSLHPNETHLGYWGLLPVSNHMSWFHFLVSYSRGTSSRPSRWANWHPQAHLNAHVFGLWGLLYSLLTTISLSKRKKDETGKRKFTLGEYVLVARNSLGHYLLPFLSFYYLFIYLFFWRRVGRLWLRCKEWHWLEFCKTHTIINLCMTHFVLFHF